MKMIVFFTSEPGGAAILIPVIRLLEQQNKYKTIVTGYGFGLSRFLQNGVKCIEINKISRNDMEIFDRYNPDLIITSATSLPGFDMSEKYLWHNARAAGVKTLAFLDQWQNYTQRFSGPSDDEKLKYLPDFINCIDSTARKEMVSEGFNDDILFTMGHPYLTGLRDSYNNISFEEIKKKLNLGIINPEKTLLFVSEAIREHYGSARGYDQYQVLDYFLLNVRRSAPDALVLVKLHPKDEIKNFDEITSKFNDINLIYCHNELSSLESIYIADRIFGMTSIMLIEGFILGKAVVSLQPGLKIEDPLVLSRNKKVPLLKDYEEFDAFCFRPGNAGSFNINFDKKEFLNFLEWLLNHNIRNTNEYK